jgi:hypothetical protein
MNFLDAINAHVAWKLRLQRYLDGSSEEYLEPEHVCKDDQCMLGKWIYGNEDRYITSEAFDDVRGKHAEFHKMAAEIVRLVNTEHKKEASEKLRGDYSQLSYRLVALIRQLARDLNFQA